MFTMITYPDGERTVGTVEHPNEAGFEWKGRRLCHSCGTFATTGTTTCDVDGVIHNMSVLKCQRCDVTLIQKPPEEADPQKRRLSVYAYPVLVVKFPDIEAETDQEAIDQVADNFDWNDIKPNGKPARAEFADTAEGFEAFMVTDEETEQTTWYGPDGKSPLMPPEEQKSLLAVCQGLMELCREMGHTIRAFDEDCLHIEEWTHDGDDDLGYVNDDHYFQMEQSLAKYAGGPCHAA